jgi:predicted O-methyltransferase YrrM
MPDKLYSQGADEYALAFGFLTLNEVAALKQIVASLPVDAVIINIGAGTGTSALAIAEARPDLIQTTFTIDISASGPLGGLENERLAFERSGYINTPLQILGDSKVIGKFWAQPIDLLLIDGDHTLEGARGDMAAWLPKLNFNGIVGVHDMDGKTWPEVPVAAAEFLSNYKPILVADRFVFFRRP